MFKTTETTITDKLCFPALIIDKLSFQEEETNDHFRNLKNNRGNNSMFGVSHIFINESLQHKIQIAIRADGYFIGSINDIIFGVPGKYIIHAHAIVNDKILIYLFPMELTGIKHIETGFISDSEHGESGVFQNRFVGDAVEGLGIINEKFIISFCNESFGNIFDCKAVDLTGENLLSIVGIDNIDFVKEELNNNRANMTSSFELRLSNETIGEKYISVFARPRKNSSEAYCGSYLTLMDISEKVILERELIQSREKARESEQLKSAFLANMSHEIRTPMNSIIGFSSMLRYNKVAKNKRDKYLDVIIFHGKKLMELITDIIDITIIEENQVRIILAPANLNEIIDELVSKTMISIKESGKTIKLFNHKGHTEKGVIIFTDNFRVKQIFSYIINNAIKFTEEGLIEIGYRQENKDTILFFVKDTGIGIDPSMHQLIFERFRQVDDSFTRLYGGTGLGLSIARELVKLFNGQIWVESDGKHGSVFYFTIPYNVFTDNKKDITTIDMKKRVNWNDKSILVIEDDIPSSEFLTEILISRGCNVFQAINGKEALDYFKNNKIDLVLLDIQLPEMDGYQIATALRQMNTAVPIIAQTARAFAEDRDKCIEAGCNDYITKPIPYNILVNTISEYLNKI